MKQAPLFTIIAFLTIILPANFVLAADPDRDDKSSAADYEILDDTIFESVIKAMLEHTRHDPVINAEAFEVILRTGLTPFLAGEALEREIKRDYNTFPKFLQRLKLAQDARNSAQSGHNSAGKGNKARRHRRRRR